MKHLMRIGIGLLVVIFTSCNQYTSTVPLTEYNNSQIDTNLIGCWGSFSDSVLDYAMRIDAIDKNRYVLNAIDLEASKTIVVYNNFIVHSSKIDNQYYANVRVLRGQDSGRYNFYIYELRNDSLFTYSLNNVNFEKQFSNSKDFEKYILNSRGEFKTLFNPAHRMVKLGYLN